MDDRSFGLGDRDRYPVWRQQQLIENLSNYDSNSIFRQRQFSILWMLGVTTIAALLMVKHSFWATIIAIEWFSTYLFTAGLTKRLPDDIENRMVTNCLDCNGTLDQNRVAVEKKQLRRLFWQLLLVIAVLFLLPTNCFLWYFRLAETWPDGGDIAIAFLWVMLSSVIAPAIYIKLLRNFEVRLADRQQFYWNKDTRAGSKSPFT